jgi:hypothetical protein
MSSLLRAKDSSHLVKEFLQRTNAALIEADEPSRKKRKRQQDASIAQPTVDQEQIVQRHIQTLLAIDKTMARPPVKALKGNPNKRSRMDIAMARLEKDHDQDSKKRKTANLAAGAARSSAVQSQLVHEPTYNKKRHTKEQKKRHLENLAKALKKFSKSKKKSKAKK